jgi:hypothetical protein
MTQYKSSTFGTTVVRFNGQILLLITSTLCAVIVIELIYYHFPHQHEYKLHRHINFYGDNNMIFENKDDIFTYSANKDIRRMSIYLNDGAGFGIEYDYRFHTNNFGLVQDADIVPNVNSMLFLGDSFTEGQGAAPWFRYVAGQISTLGYQPINGGLLGTGFAQWSKLDTYLTKKSIRIHKIVVLFISHDYTRRIWQLSDQTLQCLSVASRCRDDELYYPMPPMEELSSWVYRIKEDRRQVLFKDRIKSLVPASYRVYDFVKAGLQSTASDDLTALNAQRSDVAIAELIEKYGTANVTFIHLPQIDEVNGANRLGLSARRSIERAGGRLYDGFKLCSLTRSDYHVNDGHPNEKGYAKIALCAGRIIKEWGARRTDTQASTAGR